jgi:hypothetical protein
MLAVVSVWEEYVSSERFPLFWRVIISFDIKGALTLGVRDSSVESPNTMLVN